MNPHGGPHGGPHGPHGPQHYQPYPDLASPHSHSPAPDTSPFNGHPAGGPTNPNTPHHPHHHMEPHHPHQHPALGGPHHHHNHHHHLNNNNNNNTTNNNNNNNSVLGGSAKMCGGCGGKIVERFLLHALDRYWHHGCLKCTYCGGQLADLGASCFTKAGMILCKADYARLFGNTGACAACGQTIPASEFVMRVGGGPGPLPQGGPAAPAPLHVFHLKCFSCSKCGSQLVPGDRYYLLGGALVCEQDWHKIIKGGAAGVAAAPATQTVRKGKVGRPRRSRD